MTNQAHPWLIAIKDDRANPDHSVHEERFLGTQDEAMDRAKALITAGVGDWADLTLA